MENVGIQAAAVNNVQPQTTVKKVEQVQVKDYPNDSVEFVNTAKTNSLTKEEKQEKILQARTTAAGWSAFGGIISTACYALRSDEKFVGKVLNVLIESKTEKEGKVILNSRAGNNKIVHFEDSTKNIGDFVDVKITKAQTWCLYGEVAN